MCPLCGPLWSALEANSPFPTPEYFIEKNQHCSKTTSSSTTTRTASSSTRTRTPSSSTGALTITSTSTFQA